MTLLTRLCYWMLRVTCLLLDYAYINKLKTLVQKIAHIDDTNQTWPRTPLVLLGLEWFGFGSVTSVLLPMQQLRPQPLPLSIGAQASQECPEKSRKYHCQYHHNKSWEINVDENGIQNLWFYFSIPNYTAPS